MKLVFNPPYEKILKVEIGRDYFLKHIKNELTFPGTIKIDLNQFVDADFGDGLCVEAQVNAEQIETDFCVAVLLLAKEGFWGNNPQIDVPIGSGKWIIEDKKHNKDVPDIHEYTEWEEFLRLASIKTPGEIMGCEDKYADIIRYTNSGLWDADGIAHFDYFYGNLQPRIFLEYPDELFPAKKSGKYGFVNKNLDIIIEMEYDYAANFNDGLARVMVKEKWGFINKQGKVVVPIIHKYVRDFSEGFAIVVIENGYQGYINPDGEWVIKPKYSDTCPFKHGLAVVERNGLGLFGVIDKEENLLLSFLYEKIKIMNPNEFIVQEKGKIKWIDDTGKELKDKPITSYNELYL